MSGFVGVQHGECMRDFVLESLFRFDFANFGSGRLNLDAYVAVIGSGDRNAVAEAYPPVVQPGAYDRYLWQASVRCPDLCGMHPQCYRFRLGDEVRRSRQDGCREAPAVFGVLNLEQKSAGAGIDGEKGVADFEAPLAHPLAGKNYARNTAT